MEVQTRENPARNDSPGYTALENSIDARPALPISVNSIWLEAERFRDELARIISKELDAQRVKAWIIKSKPGEYPVNLAVNVWRPITETDITTTFDRSSLDISISVTPYLENNLNFEVKLDRHSKSFSGAYWMLPPVEVVELTKYLINGGSKPAFFKSRVPPIERFLGAFLPFVGKPPENKLIAEARPNYWTLANFLGWAGVAITVFFGFTAYNNYSDYYSETSSFIYFLFTALGLFAIFIAAYISKRRPILDAVPKQSIRNPRREFLIDSWHVSVPDAGQNFDEFHSRLHNAVLRSNPSVEANNELHQNVTPTSIEERERLVLTKGQATLHLHIYHYTNDVFVGWESYINWNRWAEGESVSKTVRPDGSIVNYKSLDVGVHVPTDFDLIEANVLAETVHRVLVKEIKSFLKERDIEADLDFKIIRGDRGKALKEGEESKG